MEESIYVEVAKKLKIAEKMLNIENPDACFLHCQEAGRLIAGIKKEEKNDCLPQMIEKLAFIKRKLNSLIIIKLRNSSANINTKQIL